jgi:hypothetical protein
MFFSKDRNRNIEFAIWSGLGICMIVSITAWIAYKFDFTDLNQKFVTLGNTFNLPGFLIGALSIGIMLVVAYYQNQQIESLNNLNKELQARDAAVKRVKALFMASKNKKYTCVMPVVYRQKPVPAIEAGDYYAWHVIQSFEDYIKIDMCHVIRGDRKANADSFRENIIFLCSPKTNPTLNALAPSIPLTLDYKVEYTDDMNRINKIRLPVWFGSRIVAKYSIANTSGENGTPCEDTRNAFWEQKVICFIPRGGFTDGEQVDVLTSQAEDDYIRAERLPENEKPEGSPGKKEDMALIIRADPGLLDKGQPDNDGNKVIVIAGIHQYGTWIAGDFIESFCKGKRPEVDDLFNSEDDFALVVYGRFNEQEIRVDWSEVHLKDAWRFNGKHWEIYEIKKERTIAATGL